MSDVNFKHLNKEMSDGGGAASFTILVVVVFLVGTLFAWANYAELDNVTRGEGRVISSLQNQFLPLPIFHMHLEVMWWIRHL